MKKIGKEVLFLGTDDSVKRNGEGALIRLLDGRIMYAYTEYASKGGDHDWAKLVALFSSDEGETWGDKRTLLTPSEGDSNIMSISLLRMQNGDLGLFFLRKRDGNCRLTLARSKDEGLSFYNEVTCCDEGYYVVNNDRVVRLKNGTLIFPANLHIRADSGYSVQYYFVSEDDGYTWERLGGLYHPFPDSTTGLQEGGVYQYEDESLFGWARTRSGSQFLTYSKDGGKNWTAPCGSEVFTSPDSPMQVKKVGPVTVAVLNPKPRYYARTELEEAERGTKLWGRTPLICLVSRDDGKHFEESFLLEDDPENAYCYPAIFEGEDYFLVAYYHSGGTGICLSGCKITKVYYSELEGGYTPPKKKKKLFLEGTNPMQEFSRDQLKIKKYETRQEMGKSAAAEAEKIINEIIEQKGEINMIFAAAPSQNEMLENLLNSSVEWNRVNALHMDEYVGLPKGDSHTFGSYLYEHIFGKKNFKSVHYITPDKNNPEEECKRYAELLKKFPVDVVCLGIGENGHIAFNDPWVAKFDDKEAVKVVKLDEMCRNQQVNDGCFPTLDDVPTHAVTLTIPTLLSAKHLFCVVPAQTKANAVRDTVYGPITEDCPASIMRNHPSATLYCDADSGVYLTEE